MRQGLGGEGTRARGAAVFDNLDDRETRIRKGRETRSRSLANSETLQNLIMAQIHEAAKSPTAAFQASAAIKAFSLAAQAMERLQAMSWKALGLERDEDTDELPTILIRDLNDDELDHIRAGHGNGEADDDCDADAERESTFRPTSPRSRRAQRRGCNSSLSDRTNSARSRASRATASDSVQSRCGDARYRRRPVRAQARML